MEKTAVFFVAGYPGLGGTQEYTFMLAKKMLMHCKVYLAMPFDPEQETQYGRPFEALGGAMIRLPETLYTRLCSRRPDKRLIGAYQLKRLLKSTARSHGSMRVIVHASLDPVSSFFSALWAARNGVAVTVFHDFGRIDAKSVSYSLNSFLLALLPKRTAAFVVPSQDVKSKLLRFVASVPADRVNVINTGVDPLPIVAQKRTAMPPDGPTFFMLGRLAEAKAPLIWLEAVHGHIRDGGTGQFLWVGSGPLLEACKEYVERHALADRVTFTGYVADVADAIREADVLLFSSIWEGGCLPRGILESIFQGFSCVLPKLPTLVESLGEDDALAWFYAPGDAVSLKEVIGNVIEEFESLPVKAEKARAHALEHHTAQKEFAQTLDLYQRLIA
nr:glycosyltransferase [Kordiimonas marina]